MSAGDGRGRTGLKGAVVEAAGPAALALGVIVFLAPLLFGGKLYIFRDHLLFFLPMKASVARAFQAGIFPFLHPELSLGVPFFETWQPALLYPPSLIFLVAPFPLSYNLFLGAHLFIAALGAYLAALRRLGCRWTALTAALLFAFGGTTVSMINLLNLLQAVVWVPWAFLCFVGTRDDDGRLRRRRIALAVVLAVQLLAGGPEIVLMELALLAGHALWTGRKENRSAVSRNLLTGLVAPGLLACALAAVQLLPTADFLSRTTRMTGMDTGDTLGFSLSPLALHNLLLPKDYVDPAGNFGAGGVLDGGYPGSEFSFPYFLSLYHGTLFLPLLAAWWIGLSRRRRILSAMAGLAVLAAASIGAVPGAVDWIRERGILLPGFRYPSKLFFLWSTAAVAAAAAGLRAVTSGEGRAGRVVLSALLAVAAFDALLSTLCSLVPGRVASALCALTGVSFAEALDPLALKVASLRSVSLRCALIAATLAGAVAFLRARPGGGKGIGTAAAAAIPLVVAADLFLAHRDLNAPVEAATVLAAPAVLDAVRPGRRGTRLLVSDIPAEDFDRRLPLVENVRRFRLAWLSPDLNALHGVSSLTSATLFIYATEGHRRLESLLRGGLSPEGFARLLRALDVGTFLTSEPFEASGVRALGVPLEGGTALEIDGTWGRAYLAQTVVFNEAPIEAAPAWLDDARRRDREVLVGDGAPAAGYPEVAEGEVAFLRMGWNDLALTVTTGTGGLVVVTTFPDPGWRAEVDGRPADLVEVFGIVMGVPVGPGRHEVTLTYRPRLFLIGAIISSAALVLTLILALSPPGRRPAT